MAMADSALKNDRRRAAKPLLWIGIASMIMAFAGLTSGYIVSRSSLIEANTWLYFDIPSEFYISTAIIIASSFVMTFAVRSARAGSMGKAKLLLLLTLIAGLVFSGFQVLGWSQLTQNEIRFTGEGSNVAGSWFYIITWFHLLHVTGGLITLLVTWVKAQMGKYSQDDYLGIEMAAIFWHFVDILWIFLFLFLAIFR
ncbi:MAG: heme-copper oxidase subunit III [Bacteroidetes bacterium]|nr:MAG: heme-copper oxidase subunit III [Bacteroidota bacterium]